MVKFKSQIMEPRLVVFIDDGNLSQMILCAEDQEIAEIPGKMLVDGLFHLLASYYVYGVAYPKGCTALLYFLQDILMGKPDTHGPVKNRPTCKTFISRLQKTLFYIVLVGCK